MKKLILLIVIALSVSQLWSQTGIGSSKQSNTNADRDFRIPLIGEQAPSFKAESTAGTINFPGDFGRSWKILLSHPADFTPVCTSEILEFANLQDEFAKLNVKLIVVSTDQLSTHVQWKKAIEGLNYKGRGMVKVKFPLVDDDSRTIAKEYGMIHSASNTTKDVRGVFIIDPDNVIKAIYFYPMNVGRSTDELVRTITALQTTESDQVMTPANWKAGNDLLIPFPPSGYKDTPESIPEGFYNLAWFMWYKKAAN